MEKREFGYGYLWVAVVKVQLVYAELMNGVTLEMLGDPFVAIISDTGVFVVTTKETSLTYDEEFYAVGVEAIEAYGIEYRFLTIK